MSDIDSSLSAVSSVSDGEFWAGLDHKPVINDLASGLDDSTRPFSTFEDTHNFELSLELIKRQSKAQSPASKGSAQAAEALYLKRFEQSLEMLRKAKKVEVANSSVVVKHSMVREFEGKLGSLQQSFQAQKTAHRRDIEFIKGELMGKKGEIRRLQAIIEEQEMLITQLRLNQRVSVAPSMMLDSVMHEPLPSYQSQASIDINVEAEIAKAQVDSLNQVVEQYRKEAENKDNLVKEMNEKMIKMQRSFDMERIKFSLEVASIREDCTQERDDALRQLKEFRQQASIESKLNEEIQKRLQDVIAKLQEELRTAKLVLSHPKLRTKIFTRMKDVENAKEQLKLETDMDRSPSAASRTSKASRRFGHSIHINQPPIPKVWNPKDHLAYMQTAELDRSIDLRSASAKRATSAHHSREVPRAL